MDFFPDMFWGGSLRRLLGNQMAVGCGLAGDIEAGATARCISDRRGGSAC